MLHADTGARTLTRDGQRVGGEKGVPADFGARASGRGGAARMQRAVRTSCSTPAGQLAAT